MELWDIYDEDRRLTGRTMLRGEAYPEGGYHLVVHMCVFNSRGEMLLQRRHPEKDDWSGMWDVTMGGSAVAGEDSRTAAQREVMEEMGICVDLTGVRPALTCCRPHIFNDIYFVDRDLELSELTFQPEEVCDAKWAGEDEVLAMLEAGTFIPYHESFIRYLFALHRAGGNLHRYEG
jgi:isopentenyldiphosphate isomerase